MPASLSLTERGVSFQDRHSLVIGTSREDNLCHSSSTQYMMSYITFLQVLHHNFCNHREQKWNRLFTRPIFPCVVKNGLGTRLPPPPSLGTRQEGLGDRLGQKCSVPMECRCASDWFMNTCLRVFMGNINRNPLLQFKETKTSSRLWAQ